MSILVITSCLLFASCFAVEINRIKEMPSTGPSFSEEPSDSYIVRTKSAVLTCKALNALNAWFECNSVNPRKIQTQQSGHNYVDPQTGIRIIELQIEITRNDIEEYTKSFSSSFNSGAMVPFQCWCHAYGGHQTIQSRKASVQFAFLRRHFINEPISQSVPIGKQTSFTCLPPEGYPKPKIFWMKNGEVIELKNKSKNDDDESLLSDSLDAYDNESDRQVDQRTGVGKKVSSNIDYRNYLITHDGTLIIKEAKLTDQGNFTCSVRNAAAVRNSEIATLVVYVNGGWSPWSEWSDCSVKCGRGIQRRTRFCSNPTPINGGQSCVGETEQTADCSVICAPVNGQWTSWSSWSTCSHDCQQVRRRTCTNPSPKYGGQHCVGPDFHIKNCTNGMCRKSDANQFGRRDRGEQNHLMPSAASESNEREIYLLCLVTIITILTLFGIFAFFVLMKHRSFKHQLPIDEERGDEDENTLLRLLQQQQRPDLIRNGGEKMQLITRINNYNSNLLEHLIVRSDHLVPNVNSTNFETNLMTNNTSNSSVMSTPKSTATASAPSVVTTTTATATSEDDSIESEPEYAEPVLTNMSTYQYERRPPLPTTSPPSRNLNAELKKALELYRLRS